MFLRDPRSPKNNRKKTTVKKQPSPPTQLHRPRGLPSIRSDPEERLVSVCVSAYTHGKMRTAPPPPPFQLPWVVVPAELVCRT